MTVTSDLHGLGAEDVLAIQAVIMKYGFLIDDREFFRLAASPTSPIAISSYAHQPDGGSKTNPPAATGSADDTEPTGKVE